CLTNASRGCSGCAWVLRFPSQADPAPRIIHAVDGFVLPPSTLDRPIRGLTQGSYQRAQTREAIGSYETAEDQFSQRLLNHARQQVGARHDVGKEGGSVLPQILVNGCRVRVERRPIRFGRCWIRPIPYLSVSPIQKHYRRAANRGGAIGPFRRQSRRRQT